MDSGLSGVEVHPFGDSSEDWSLYTSEDGHPYWYNHVTCESKWADTSTLGDDGSHSYGAYSESYQQHDGQDHSLWADEEVHSRLQYRPEASHRQEAYASDEGEESTYVDGESRSNESSEVPTNTSDASDLEEKFQAYLATEEGRRAYEAEIQRIESAFEERETNDGGNTGLSFETYMDGSYEWQPQSYHPQSNLEPDLSVIRRRSTANARPKFPDAWGLSDADAEHDSSSQYPQAWGMNNASEMSRNGRKHGKYSDAKKPKQLPSSVVLASHNLSERQTYSDDDEGDGDEYGSDVSDSSLDAAMRDATRLSIPPMAMWGDYIKR